MDLDEWELLSHANFLDLHEDQQINNNSPKFKQNSTTVIDMNYFHKFSEPQIRKNNLRVIPVPIKFDQEQNFEENPEELINNFDDSEIISKVFFKKIKENEFVDTKLVSPKSSNRGILPQFVEKEVKGENFEKENGEKLVGYEEKKVKNEGKKSKRENDGENNNGGVNIWKWAMTGIGAVFTFGFTAVTISLIVFSNRHRTESNHFKDQELHFQIHSHDKRFKQVVSHAKSLNEAISVMRGAPVTSARITVGGYEGL